MKAKKIATWIIVPLMISIFVLDIITVVLCNRHCAAYSFTQERFDGSCGDDRIHFLNTANSDCILLESNGHFALIDAGEGSENPRRAPGTPGYEDRVLRYIKQVAVDKDGNAHLDFILATHYHYDHIGGFHALLTDPDITVDRAYFKPYDPKMDKSYEIEVWKIPELYGQLIDDLNARQIETVSVLPDQPFAFGDLTLQFFNTVSGSAYDGEGENARSVCTLVTKGDTRIFLAADLTWTTGLEQALRDQIGDIDLLKAGHHGYLGSSSMAFLRAVTPEIIIVTNQLGKIYPNVKWNMTMTVPAAIFATYDRNGIIVSVTDDGKLLLTENIHQPDTAG